MKVPTTTAKLMDGASGSPPSTWFSLRSLARMPSLIPPCFEDFCAIFCATIASESSS
eukprot:CAMPEP_0180158442 /NCGR_PEP_ID=MMETSP0986-20121125/26905_1 /TAXON_ID=697907 /ORGANISM="non described non described, Strain CCMP2293" /LENGTH=56 /DNA_ID=CAMNT_0022108285 /DNA_START=87 /DNA_END=257 /DNA_ORIENTATION=+